MSLRGISLEVQQPAVVIPEREFAFREGAIDIPEAVGVSLQALAELGLAVDRDEAEETMTEDFSKLVNLGFAGRAYVLPAETVPFNHIVDIAEGKRPRGVSEKYVYPNLWTPGTETQSFSEEDLNRGPKSHVARLAVFNASNTGVDPMLHHLGLPADDYAKTRWNPSADTTQEAEVIADISRFSAEYPNYTLESSNQRAFAMWTLMDRIRGIDPKSPEFVLNQGWMRILDLGRRTVDGGSCVGGVGSGQGRSDFVRGGGIALGDHGVGLSVGLEEKLNP